jgi:hypothetical protein
MKRLLLGLAAVALPFSGLTQGTINFINLDSTRGVHAPVYLSDLVTKLSGPQYQAELLAGPGPSSLGPITATGFLRGESAGYFNGGTQVVPTVNGGALAWVEVRVWNTASGTSFDQALASGLPDSWWASSIFTVQTGDPNLGGGPSIPGPLTGLGTSPVYLNSIPEPSTFSLLGLGVIVALFRVRRRSMPNLTQRTPRTVSGFDFDQWRGVAGSDCWPTYTMTSLTPLFILLVATAVVVLPLRWLARCRRARRLKEQELAELFERPYTGPASFSFRFESTHRDLLDAHAAQQASQSWLCPSPLERALATGFGMFWIGCAIVFGPKAIKEGTWWRALILFALGTSIIGTCLLKPFLARRRIRQTTPATQPITVAFTGSGIHIEASGIGVFDRTWDELVGVELAEKGVAFAFTDGLVNWLPNRVFQAQSERRVCAAYLISKLPKEQEVPNEA